MINEKEFFNATGKIDFNMTNDYMFRVILQENKIVLRGLICSLLHMESSDIASVEIQNPIILGENIDEKTFVLDVNILLNDDTLINLEMQMLDVHNWTDRALNYTCRNFTHLQKGHNYAESKTVIHIGFLNYTLFPEHPEFYATYKLLNIKNHHLFSSKIQIGVVNLTKEELATEEDIRYGINQWTALFKSKTWEELKMIAKEQPELLEASKSLYEYNNETTIRYQCYAREDYQKMMDGIRQTEKEQTEQLKKQKELLKNLTSQNHTLASQVDVLASQNDVLTSQNDVLTSQNDVLTSQNDVLTSQNDALNSQLAEQNLYIKEKESYIKELEAKLKELHQ